MRGVTQLSNPRLAKALDWATLREPVRVCRACRRPVVGRRRMKLTLCPHCHCEGKQGMTPMLTMHWGDLKMWVPKNCLYVTAEEPL